MAYSYKEYNTKFGEKAAAEGFSYTFRKVLSTPFAAIGHAIDTFFGMDGLFGKDRDNYYYGPFGALLWAPFALVGFLVGNILQFVFDIPRYVGYCLDLPLFWLKLYEWIPLRYICLRLTALYNFVTGQPTPTEMQSLFGFLVGFFPEVLRVAINRGCATFTSIIEFCTDNFCGALRSIYSYVGSLIFVKKEENVSPSSSPGAPDDGQLPAVEEANVKKGKIRRAKDKYQAILEKDLELKDVVNQNTDLFSPLGITLEEYKNDNKTAARAYRRQAAAAHPDSNKGANKDGDKWQLLLKANQILGNPQRAAAYMYFFKPVSPPAGGSQPSNPTKIKETTHKSSSTATSCHNEANGNRRQFRRPGDRVQRV